MHSFCELDSSDEPPAHGIEGCIHRLHSEVRENDEQCPLHASLLYVHVTLYSETPSGWERLNWGA